MLEYGRPNIMSLRHKLSVKFIPYDSLPPITLINTLWYVAETKDKRDLYNSNIDYVLLEDWTSNIKHLNS